MTFDPLLIKASFVTYMNREDHRKDDGKLVEFWDRVEKQIRSIASELSLDIDCYSSSIYAMGAGKKPDNSGRCCACNEWVSAQNRPNIISGLAVGAEHDGKLYCLDHVPESSDMFEQFFPYGRNHENFPVEEKKKRS